MAADSSTQSDGWNSAREALAKVRAGTGGLQTFLAGVFDQLDRLASDLVAQDLACQRGQREALQAQVDRLAAVANELTVAVAEQKQLADQKKNRHDREAGRASSDT